MPANETAMHIGDVLSLGVLIGYFFAALPAVATLLTVIWTAIRIYETDTVQRWVKRKNVTPL